LPAPVKLKNNLMHQIIHYSDEARVYEIFGRCKFRGKEGVPISIRPW
jgi:hypothetical protein